MIRAYQLRHLFVRQDNDRYLDVIWRRTFYANQ